MTTLEVVLLCMLAIDGLALMRIRERAKAAQRKAEDAQQAVLQIPALVDMLDDRLTTHRQMSESTAASLLQLRKVVDGDVANMESLVRTVQELAKRSARDGGL